MRRGSSPPRLLNLPQPLASEMFCGSSLFPCRESIIITSAIPQTLEISVQLIHHPLHTGVGIAFAFILDRIHALISRIFRRFHALCEIEFCLVALRAQLDALGVTDAAGSHTQA